jgi:hypothetical protein
VLSAFQAIAVVLAAVAGTAVVLTPEPLRGLPAFADFHGAYGLLVPKIEPTLRRATDIVTRPSTGRR